MKRRERSCQGGTKGPKTRIVYASSVEDYIALAEDDVDARAMRDSGEFHGYVVYTKRECELLKGKPREVIRLCHTAKRLFEGTINGIRPNDGSSTAR